MALTALALAEPTWELDGLAALQQARYVDGQDLTSLETLAALLRSLKLDAAADRLAAPDAALLDAVRARTGRAQALMQGLGARGVPAFIVEADGQRRLLQTSAIYTDPQALAKQLETA